jgi:hypothetical protein|tara:strand:- start:8524 stop:9162 length:639 start_codon:yes stop_codon:yes gene_type:complete
MVTTYCSVEDVSDFLRVPINANTTPNKTQVEKIINRKESEFERRTGHAWRTKKITREVHSLPLLYTFGWGTPIFLRHRRIYDLDDSAGDKVEIWQGASAIWENIVTNGQWFDMEYERGSLHLRGFLFSILRKNRVRVTYRYGGEEFAGDTVIPDDIKDCIIKMTAIDIMNTSFRMDELPSGGTTSPSESKKYWQEDIENCIINRREVVVVGL